MGGCPLLVSIHAPTRGATGAGGGGVAAIFGFNPRAHAGRDKVGPVQTSHPEPGFNPRAHAGRDH